MDVSPRRTSKGFPFSWTPRQQLIGLLLVAAMLGMGCNVLHLPYILFMPFMPDPKLPATLKNLAEDGKKVKVVILTVRPADAGVEFIKVDEELSSKLAYHLQQRFKNNKDDVQIVSSAKVAKFKDEHPDWCEMEKQEIGRHFKADYVIGLEIDSISLFEKGSANQLCRGRASISVSLSDMNKPDEEPLTKTYACEYPTEAKGPVPINSEGELAVFRQAFMEFLSERLAWHFAEHTIHEDRSCE